jgi:hypothetical protein
VFCIIPFPLLFHCLLALQAVRSTGGPVGGCGGTNCRADFALHRALLLAVAAIGAPPFEPPFTNRRSGWRPGGSPRSGQVCLAPTGTADRFARR